MIVITGLKSIVVPGSVKSIGSGAFTHCASLSSVELTIYKGSQTENMINKIIDLAKLYEEHGSKLHFDCEINYVSDSSEDDDEDYRATSGTAVNGDDTSVTKDSKTTSNTLLIIVICVIVVLAAGVGVVIYKKKKK